MCCLWVGYKKYDGKNNRREGVAEGQKRQREFSKYPFKNRSTLLLNGWIFCPGDVGI